jgi:uncharacterized protein (DUF4415 family)
LPPTEICARSQTSSGHSTGASSSLKLSFVFLSFAVIRFPHRDNVPPLSSRGPDHRDQPALQQAERLPSDLTIFLPIILDIECRAGENMDGIVKIQTPDCEDQSALLGVVGDFHGSLTLIKKLMLMAGAPSSPAYYFFFCEPDRSGVIYVTTKFLAVKRFSVPSILPPSRECDSSLSANISRVISTFAESVNKLRRTGMSGKYPTPTGPDRDDPPRFTRDMAERGRHMIGDRVIREARPRGRPRKEAGERKEKVTLRLSPEVLSYFRAQGDGWQTRIDRLLTDHVRRAMLPDAERLLRKRASR